MDWFWDTVYLEEKKESWTEYVQSLLKTTGEYTTDLLHLLMETFSVTIIPAVCVLLENVKSMLKVAMDIVHKQFFPWLCHCLEQIDISANVFFKYAQVYSKSLYGWCLQAGGDAFQGFYFYTSYILRNFTSLIKECFHLVRLYATFTYHHLSMFPPYKLCVMAVILVLMICCVIMLVYTCKKHKRSRNNPTNIAQERCSNGIENSLSFNGEEDHCTDCTKVTRRQRSVLWTVQWTILALCVAGFLVGIPWEFVRLYQNEMARKASITIVGMPDSCLPNRNMSTWQSLKSWFLWQLSWSHDPCEEYHRALLVDPFWEVTPMMVLSSALTRCVTVPLETVSAGLGRSVRNLFAEIPVTWQPVVMVTLLLLLVTSVILLCSYKLTLPLLLSLEPSKRTPVIFRTCRVRARKTNRKHNHKHRRRHRKDKYYSDESDNSLDRSY